ncbi:uncharacterized protein SAPINGB_P000459 [Magnusiomyces paraingens]|uniref:Uncharacterized protein n=1 Tax=Magnusiomyces paraingens TaxID=2606893 RepID=A0A5E8AZW6_9ASCO|nr:uncharacterized protein SAPINGB_P000459 [Saprochaete ingens]VVT44567.1 unnamed protein product [Saprochaete ingens]
MLKEFPGLVAVVDFKPIKTILDELEHALERKVDHVLDCVNNRLMGTGFSSLQEYPVSEWFTPDTRPTRMSVAVDNLRQAVRNYERDYEKNAKMYPDSLMMNVLYTQHLAAYHLCLSMNEAYQPELREVSSNYGKFCEEGNLPEFYPNPYIAFLKELTKILEKKESVSFEALRDYPSPYYEEPDTLSSGISVRNDAQVRNDPTNMEYVVYKKLHPGGLLPAGPRELIERPAAKARPKSKSGSTKKMNNIHEVYGDLPADMTKWTEEQMFDGFEKLLDAFPVCTFLMPLFKPQVDFLVKMHGKDCAELDDVRKMLNRGEFTVTRKAGSGKVFEKIGYPKFGRKSK